MGTTILNSDYEMSPGDNDPVNEGAGKIRTTHSNVRKNLRGRLDISITNLNTDDKNMKIEVGSILEVNGVLIEITTADEPITAFTGESTSFPP